MAAGFMLNLLYVLKRCNAERISVIMTPEKAVNLLESLTGADRMFTIRITQFRLSGPDYTTRECFDWKELKCISICLSVELN